MLIVYAGALALWRDSVPPGLNNDAAEEALRGIQLLDAGRLQVLSSSPGIPQETLYLYAVALISRVLGTTTLPIHLLSWASALACLWLVVQAARRADPNLPTWVPLLLAASSLWLFHYGRAGVRAISAPCFALAVGLALDQAERRLARWRPAMLCGALLGLSLYAYTACRVLLVVFLLHAGLRLWRGQSARRLRIRCYALVLTTALVVSIPNLLFAASSPAAFFLRGSYVVRGGWQATATHLAASVLVPLRYADRYRTIAGDTYIFDGVSAGLTAAGLDPSSPLLAAACALGLVAAWRRRQEPIVLYLLLLWPVGTLLLGFTGPSLTRLLIVLPSLLVIGALGAGTVIERWPRAAPVVAAVLAAAVALSAREYFSPFAHSMAARAYFSPAATPMGQRAAALAANGQRVLCVVTKDANVVRYLTHDVADRVDVVEYYRRPFDARDLSPVFRPQVALVERARALDGVAAALGQPHPPASRAAFDEIRLD
jgi:hypothetical protein